MPARAAPAPMLPGAGGAARAGFGAAAVPSASAARPPSPAARQGRAVGGSVATSPGAKRRPRPPRSPRPHRLAIAGRPFESWLAAEPPAGDGRRVAAPGTADRWKLRAAEPPS